MSLGENDQDKSNIWIVCVVLLCNILTSLFFLLQVKMMSLGKTYVTMRQSANQVAMCVHSRIVTCIKFIVMISLIYLKCIQNLQNTSSKTLKLRLTSEMWVLPYLPLLMLCSFHKLLLYLLKMNQKVAWLMSCTRTVISHMFLDSVIYPSLSLYMVINLISLTVKPLI